MRKFLVRWFSKPSGFILFDDLTEGNFNDHKIWLDIHLDDFGNEQYADVDDEAFRPWDSSYPARREFSGLVAANFMTQNGISLFGYVSNIDGQDNETRNPIVNHQPTIFTSDGTISFWHGAVYQFGRKFLDADIFELRKITDSNLDDIFPIQYQTATNAIAPPIAATIDGFGYFSGENVVTFEAESAG